MERVLDTARACASAEDILAITDSDEIGLICERAKVQYIVSPGQQSPEQILSCLLDKMDKSFRHCVFLDPSSPLVTWVDVENAWRKYLRHDADALFTVKRLHECPWEKTRDEPRELLATALGACKKEKDFLARSPALAIFKLVFLRNPVTSGRLCPFFLEERSLEIRGYQDWWICERLLERRHVVFVVAGYPAIGMGHVYRALMLAHEINNHKITFVCTRESELAVEQVASRDYRVVRQCDEQLAETVLAQSPDLVINDFLDSKKEYIEKIHEYGAKCVNFEDEGSGAKVADLVINALYETPENNAHWRCGPEYFCLRDEFVNAVRNPLRPQVKVLLISFGGTDQHNATLRVLNIVEPICRAFGIAIRIVAGPGYAHKRTLEDRLMELQNPLINFTWATNIMSRMMEGADLAICSAGRTVYELAHMRIPGIVLASHKRESRHRFARPAHGFAFAGIMGQIGDGRIRNMFLAMLKQERRARYWHRQNCLNFTGNKERVVGLLQDQLEKSEAV